MDPDLKGCSSEEHIGELLSESVESSKRRAQTSFDELAGVRGQSLVLYGAGNLGRMVLRGLRSHGLDALAFADANPALWGKEIEGLRVLSPDEAVRKYGNGAAFVVCVWNSDPHHGVQSILTRLKTMGAGQVFPFISLLWKCSGMLLPHYSLDAPYTYLAHRDELRLVYNSLEDEASRAQFVGELELRIRGSFAGLPPPCETVQYFPRNLFRLSADECFVDCGAYDGDTIRVFVKESNGSFRRIIAFEADPGNFSRLQDYVRNCLEFRGRIKIHQTAVAKAAGVLRFAATAGIDAAVSPQGENIVSCIKLDKALSAESPTMIKMDVEGSELDALEGAAGVIASHEPLLAVCIYHRPEHFWRIPLWLKNAEPEARIYLRSYSVDCWESVCYAVPPGRSASLNN